MSTLEYSSSIVNIIFDDEFASQIEEETELTGYNCLQLFALDKNNPHRAREQLRTIEAIMKAIIYFFPSHPNIPRMTARAIGIHSPTHIALKEVGTPFSTNNLSKSDKIACMEQLSCVLSVLHDDNVAHGNICVESLRLKRTPNAEIQLIGLQDAILNATEEKEKDLLDFDILCKKLGVPTPDNNGLQAINIIHADNSVWYNYENFEVIANRSDCDSTEGITPYISVGTFSTISIAGLNHSEIEQLAKLSTHTQFLTIYTEDKVLSPLKNTLLMDYHCGGMTLSSVIHGEHSYGLRTALRWIDQITQGVIFLSEQKYVHGAICPENLMKFGDHIKIVRLENIFQKMRDTRLYYLDHRYNLSNEKSTFPTSDEYSLRITSYEILTRRYPTEMWEKTSQTEVLIEYENTFPLDKIDADYRTNYVFHLDYLSVLAYIMQLKNTSTDFNIGQIAQDALPVDYLSLIFRNINLIETNDLQIAPPIRKELYIDRHGSLPLIELLINFAENKNIYFKSDGAKHIKFTSSGPRRITNKANLLKCDCLSTCEDDKLLFTNRAVQFGETVKISIEKTERSETEIVNSVELVSENKCFYNMIIASSAVIYRLTDELICVHSKIKFGGYRCDKFWSDLNSPLCIQIKLGIKSVTIKHANPQEVTDATTPSKMDEPSPDPFKKPYRMELNSLRPDIDFIVVNESSISKPGDNTSFYLNISGIQFPTEELVDDRRLVLKSIEYNLSRYTFIRDKSFNHLEDYQIHYNACVLLCDYTMSKRDPYHTLVNFRGFVRDEHGVTGFLMDHITGSLWDKVILNDSVKFELKQVYTWLKQISLALDLLLPKHSFYYPFNSETIFVTENKTLKLFHTSLMKIDNMYHREGRGRSRYEPKNSSIIIPEDYDYSVYYGGEQLYYDDTTLYNLGTVLWDMLHRSDVPLNTPDHMKDYENYEIVETAGNPELRDLIRRCWSADKTIQPTFKEIISLATKTLTELEFSFVLECDLKFDDEKKRSFSQGRDSSIQHVNIPTIKLNSAVYKRFREMKEDYMRRELETYRIAVANPFFTVCHAIVGTYEDIKGLILEEMQGDLWTQVIKNESLSYGPSETSRWSWQIASALAFLHNQHIIHRDIKPHNILVDNNFVNVKLTDFGIVTKAEKTTGFNGTAKYVAPEAMYWEQGERYNHTIDIYAFGVSLFELVERRDFQYRPNENVIVQTDLDTANLSFAIERCCSHNPYERPRSEELVEYFGKQKELFKDKPSLGFLEVTERPKKHARFEME